MDRTDAVPPPPPAAVRAYHDEKRYWDLIALRLQFLYRRFIARRHAVRALTSPPTPGPT